MSQTSDYPKPLWPLPEGYTKPRVTTRGGKYEVWTDTICIGPFDSLAEAMDEARGEAHNLALSTEYVQRREALAEFLCDLVYGRTMWSHNSDASLRLNYRLDADDIIKANPHLLSLEERERLADQIPELAYP